MINKRVDETINVTISFDSALATSEIISSIDNVSILPSGEAVVSNSGIFSSGKEVVVSIANGEDGSEYSFNLRVITDGGQTLEWSDIITVSNPILVATWNSSMVIVLRQMIGDFTAPYQYSDSRLRFMIVVAGIISSNDVIFNNTYTIDVEGVTISPDPVVVGDTNFIHLTCLKAAQLIAESEHKTASRSAISHKDGPASLDTRGIADNLKSVAQGKAVDYDRAVKEYRIGHGSPGTSIVGPYNLYDSENGEER
jgi:hypothetical protein